MKTILVRMYPLGTEKNYYFSMILDWAIVCSSHWRWPFEKTFAFVLSYDVLWTFFSMD